MEISHQAIINAAPRAARAALEQLRNETTSVVRLTFLGHVPATPMFLEDLITHEAGGAATQAINPAYVSEIRTKTFRPGGIAVDRPVGIGRLWRGTGNDPVEATVYASSVPILEAQVATAEELALAEEAARMVWFRLVQEVRVSFGGERAAELPDDPAEWPQGQLRLAVNATAHFAPAYQELAEVRGLRESVPGRQPVLASVEVIEADAGVPEAYAALVRSETAQALSQDMMAELVESNRLLRAQLEASGALKAKPSPKGSK